ATITPGLLTFRRSREPIARPASEVHCIPRWRVGLISAAPGQPRHPLAPSPRVLTEGRLSALIGDIRSSDSIIVPLQRSVAHVQARPQPPAPCITAECIFKAVTH